MLDRGADINAVGDDRTDDDVSILDLSDIPDEESSCRYDNTDGGENIDIGDTINRDDSITNLDDILGRGDRMSTCCSFSIEEPITDINKGE